MGGVFTQPGSQAAVEARARGIRSTPDGGRAVDFELLRLGAKGRNILAPLVLRQKLPQAEANGWLATITNAQAALRWLDQKPPELEEVRQALNSIVKDGNHASEVIDRIRALIKKAPPRKDRFEINGAIRDVIELTHTEVVKNAISLTTELEDCLPIVQGDRVQLQQVILNLIINAIEAMSGVGEGTRELLIGTGKDGSRSVLVRIGDSGPGLAAATLEHLFEPFFARLSRTAWGWGCLSAVQSWKHTADGCG
jgi:signal transduction histidine kinase